MRGKDKVKRNYGGGRSKVKDELKARSYTVSLTPSIANKIKKKHGSLTKAIKTVLD